MGLELIAAEGAKAFGGALAKLAAEHAIRTLSPGSAERIKTNIEPHIEATYRRCSVTKTLLNPLHPVSVLKLYATQMFRVNERNVDHYDLVEMLRGDIDNAIITGTGGAGKSIFTKYLWLSIFEKSDGRIPIYIELRQLNNIDKIDVELIIKSTLSQGKSSISEKEFKKNLQAGDFFLILDGFDEIVESKRQLVQQEIMSLSSNYPRMKLIVSSRPDSRFASWTTFHVVEVLPMRKEDVLELVNKSEFDRVVKSRFAKKIKNDNLYDRHESFLSNPLLTCMMLLTYSHNYDVPDKMHLFYEQAFEALYQRHDSHKAGGYKREFKTSLSADAFKRVVSYFCLLTYAAEKIEFSKSELTKFLTDAIRVDGAKANAEDLFADLTNCVCILIPDGLNFTFAHRSFQEYFSAYCLAYVTNHNFQKIVTRWAKRWSDQAITLLSDMNPEAFVEQYIIPTADIYADKLASNKNISPKMVLEWVSAPLSFIITNRNPTRGMSFYAPSKEKTGEFGLFFFVIARLVTKGGFFVIFDEKSPDAVAIEKIENIVGRKIELMYVYSEGGKARFSIASNSDDGVLDVEIDSHLEKIMESTDSVRNLANLHKSVSNVVAKYRRDNKRQGEALSDLLNFS